VETYSTFNKQDSISFIPNVIEESFGFCSSKSDSVLWRHTLKRAKKPGARTNPKMRYFLWPFFLPSHHRYFCYRYLKQFDNEKNSANTFRMYGKIDPIYCFDVYNKTTTGFQKINLDKCVFFCKVIFWSRCLMILTCTRISRVIT
jgi:hypothetical protein